MVRILILSLVLAGSVAAPMSQANARSADPALLAPGSSRAMLMPRPVMPHTGVAPRPTGGFPCPGDSSGLRLGVAVARVTRAAIGLLVRRRGLGVLGA